MKKLCEMSKQEIEEIKQKKFFTVPIEGIENCNYAILVSPEFCKILKIMNEALEIYLKEHFNESD